MDLQNIARCSSRNVGVDVNQCPQAPGAVMDNVEKKTDVAVELAVRGIMGGSPPIATLGMKEK
jgi:basic membrane protein A